jgi:hypothetical protein
MAAAVTSARAAGLSAVLLNDPTVHGAELPVILQSSRDKMAWGSATPIFSVTDNDWPGLKLDTMRGDTAVAGPTGVPWVNSNAWFSLLADVFAPGKTLWLDFDPPDTSTVAHPATYPLAVADSQAYGSRWIISLDDNLRAALSKQNSQATSVWSKTCETLAFFESHREWEKFRPQGVLAVVSNYLGDNAAQAGEVLNLLNRRQVHFQIVERSKVLSKPAPGLKAILWVDSDAPTAEQLTKLLAFVRQGGLLIATAYWGPSGVAPTRKDPSLAYKMYNVGQGQIAVSEEGFQDPYQVAMDVHMLVGRRNDLVRLYNPATTNCHSSFDPVHKRRLVQVVNYSSGAASFVTLWVNARNRSAQIWCPGVKDSRPLPGAPASTGTDFELPTIAVNCALEMEA